jgi:hypothetical protein
MFGYITSITPTYSELALHVFASAIGQKPAGWESRVSLIRLEMNYLGKALRIYSVLI